MISWLGSLQLFGLVLLLYVLAKWLLAQVLTSADKDLALFFQWTFHGCRWHFIGSDWITCHLGNHHHLQKELLFLLARPGSHVPYPTLPPPSIEPTTSERLGAQEWTLDYFSSEERKWMEPVWTRYAVCRPEGQVFLALYSLSKFTSVFYFKLWL